MDIKDRIKTLPDSPGVYIMKDSNGRAVYIGKAVSLRRRVSSYFTKARRVSARIEMMVSKTAEIDYIPTNSESQALIYEASLIKSERPKFNIELKDDKSYPYLKLTLNERYPRLVIVRRIENGGARYYGPYTNAKLLRQALSFMRFVFPLRVCRKLGRKLCMSYHISECRGPCAGKISEEDYKKITGELVLFLEGRHRMLLNELSRRMEEASGRLDFEEALRLRNRIRALGTVVVKRGMPAPMDQIDELRFLLNLRRRPKRIEAFDISDIRGKDAVGSCVSFYDGRPDKDNYRKFMIRTVKGIDDYKMMREIVRRRYTRLLGEKKGLPDLIVIDGGKGHLASAQKELEALNIAHIPAIGIAKEFEHIYAPDRELPIVLPKDSSVLQLIKRIRDEAHRFAKRYHVSLKKKGVSASELDGIKGVGFVKKRRLLEHFGSVCRIRRAKAEDLAKVKGIDGRTARKIDRYFKKKRA